MLLGGSKQGRIITVQQVNIHGSQYVDLTYNHDDDPEQPLRARLGQENIYANPQPADRIEVTYLLNVLTSVEQITD